MRLTAILTLVLLTITTPLARADDSDGPKKVLFVVSSAGSMSTVFAAAKGNLKKSVDRLAATDQVGLMFFTDGDPKKSSDHFVNADAAAKKKITGMIDAAKASGKSDPVPAVKAALAMKPDILYLLLDQVPDGDALVKAVKAGDPDKLTRVDVIYFMAEVDDQDPKQTAAVEALSQAVKFSGGQFRKIVAADVGDAAPAGPVVYALSNSGSMLAVIGIEKEDITKAVGDLPAGTKFDVILFADGKSTAMTDAPAASDARSKKVADDFLLAHPAGGKGDPLPGVTAALTMKPGKLYLTLDQVPDPAALVKAFDTGDPKKGVVPVVTYLTGNDATRDEAAIKALDKVVKARHGKLTTVKESQAAVAN